MGQPVAAPAAQEERVPMGQPVTAPAAQEERVPMGQPVPTCGPNELLHAESGACLSPAEVQHNMQAFA